MVAFSRSLVSRGADHIKTTGLHCEPLQQDLLTPMRPFDFVSLRSGNTADLRQVVDVPTGAQQAAPKRKARARRPPLTRKRAPRLRPDHAVHCYFTFVGYDCG